MHGLVGEDPSTVILFLNSPHVFEAWWVSNQWGEDQSHGDKAQQI